MGNLIPQNAATFLKFATNLRDYVGKYIGDWKHIPETAYKDLKNLIEVFEKEFQDTPKDSTRAQIERRNHAQKECEKLLRYFIRFYLRNPVVTNDQLISMEIPPLDNIRTPNKEVHETVDFVLHIKGTNNIIIDFWQTGHIRKARSKGYSGAVIIWTLADDEPKSNSDYTEHTLATRTPYTLEFDTHDSGKRCWMRIAWQNARGILGRFNEAKSAIVP